MEKISCCNQINGLNSACELMIFSVNLVLAYMSCLAVNALKPVFCWCKKVLKCYQLFCASTGFGRKFAFLKLSETL